MFIIPYFLCGFLALIGVLDLAVSPRFSLRSPTVGPSDSALFSDDLAVVASLTIYFGTTPKVLDIKMHNRVFALVGSSYAPTLGPAHGPLYLETSTTTGTQRTAIVDQFTAIIVFCMLSGSVGGTGVFRLVGKRMSNSHGPANEQPMGSVPGYVAHAHPDFILPVSTSMDIVDEFEFLDVSSLIDMLLKADIKYSSSSINECDYNIFIPGVTDSDSQLDVAPAPKNTIESKVIVDSSVSLIMPTQTIVDSAAPGLEDVTSTLSTSIRPAVSSNNETAPWTGKRTRRGKRAGRKHQRNGTPVIPIAKPVVEDAVMDTASRNVTMRARLSQEMLHRIGAFIDPKVQRPAAPPSRIPSKTPSVASESQGLSHTQPAASAVTERGEHGSDEGREQNGVPVQEQVASCEVFSTNGTGKVVAYACIPSGTDPEPNASTTSSAPLSSSTSPISPLHISSSRIHRRPIFPVSPRAEGSPRIHTLSADSTLGAVEIGIKVSRRRAARTVKVVRNGITLDAFLAV